MTQFRIAFTGASGTGKTTLAKWLAGWSGFDLCPVSARTVAAKLGYTTPYDAVAAGPAKYAEFQRMVFEERRRWELAHENFVTDRTHFDDLAYGVMHNHHMFTDEWVDAITTAQSGYSHVFALDIYDFINFDNDAARKTSMVYHRFYQAILVGLYIDSLLARGPSWMTGMGELQDRKSYIEDRLNSDDLYRQQRRTT